MHVETNEKLDIEVYDFLKLPISEQKKYCGYSAPVNFKKQHLLFDPYIIGVLLSNKKKKLDLNNPKLLFNSYDTYLDILAGYLDENYDEHSDKILNYPNAYLLYETDSKILEYLMKIVKYINCEIVVFGTKYLITGNNIKTYQ